MTGGVLPAWVRRRHRDAVAQRLLDMLSTAMLGRDLGGIRAVLHDRAVVVIDTGAPAAPPGDAAAAVAALMTPGTAITTTSVNGAPGLVLTRDRAVVGVITAQTRARRIAALWVVCNPDKLRHWNR